MQRKRRNINFGNFSKFPGKYQKQFTNSITKSTLHSIPTVRMRRSNKKSTVAKRNLFCGKWDISHFTFRNFQVNLCRVIHFSSGRFTTSRRYGCGSLIRSPLVARAREKGITATKSTNYYENFRNCINHTFRTLLDKWSGYVKFPLYIICTLLLSFVVSDMMSGFNGECYAAVNPTASLSVSNPTLSTTVAPGDTAYLSSNVTYSASDIDSYTLQVSYANGYNSLKLDGGTTTLSGAGGKTGSSLTNNSWGFAWTNNTTNNTSTNAGLTYYTVPSYGTSGSGLSTGRLENATLPESANNTLSSTTKRIVFAAKFAENNTNSGHYKTGVQLSMVATPRKMTLADISKMQDMYGNYSICTNTPLISGQKYSAEYTLTDIRDGKSYTVRKLGDNKCWMTSNLKLKLTTAGLKQSDTDLNQGADWNQNSPSDVVKPADTLTSLTSTNFSSSNYYAVESYIASSSNAGETGYYSWSAATAGTGGTSGATGNFVPKGSQAPSSICPRGWTLPTGGSYNTATDFYKLFRNMDLTISNNLDIATNTVWGSGDLNTVQNATDSNSKVIYNFKYSGNVYDGSFVIADSGRWWSSTAESATDGYVLYINSTSVYPGTFNNWRYFGFPVRCIARNS